MKSLSVDALAYEAIQKGIRNPIMRHVRRCLSREGQDLDDEIKALFREEWPKIVQAVERASAAGFERKPIDALDYLSINQLFNVFEKYWRDLIPDENLPGGQAGRATRAQVLSWLAEIKDLRNPNSHPPEQDMPVADALRLVDSGFRLLGTLAINESQTQLGEIQSELLRRMASAEFLEEAARSNILSTLPPREQMYAEFVGRTSELQELWKWFSETDAGRWALVGEGGKGKTAIAHQFCLSVVASGTDSIAAVLWMSAKRRRFEDSATLPISNPDFWDLDSALERMVRDLGLPDGGKSVEAKRTSVLEALRNLPVLVVADDLDSIEREDEDVVEFLMYDLPRVGSKVLVTSRREYPGMGRTMSRVAGLSRADAEDFTHRTAERLGIDQEVGLRQSFNRIYEATEGSPLYIEDLLRVCRQLRVSEAIDRWRQQSGDAARRYALEREEQLLSETARNALRAVCWATQPLSIAQLESILGRPEDEVLGAIRELEKVSLVPVGLVEEGIPVFKSHKNLESLVRRGMRNDPSTLPLRNAVEAVLRTIRVDDSDSDAFRQVTVLLKGRRASDALVLVERALSRRPNSPVLLALRAETLAVSTPARVADARQDWLRAADLGLNRAESYLRWIHFEDDQGDFLRMAEAADRGISACGEVGVLYQKAGYAWSRVGQSLMRGLDTESAVVRLERAEARLRKALEIAQRDRWEDYRQDRIFRALVLNAQAMTTQRGAGQVAFWVMEWIRRMPDSPDALAEANRQAPRFTEIRQQLQAWQAARPEGQHS